MLDRDFFRKILGDEYLAVSGIILFFALIQIGYGSWKKGAALLFLTTVCFVFGVYIKYHVKKQELNIKWRFKSRRYGFVKS